MRIAFAGASGTGKTTQLKLLADRYNLPINPVGSRSVALDMGFQSPYDVDAAGKRAEFQHRLIKAKIGWESGYDRFITDRTTADNLAYTILHGSPYSWISYAEEAINHLSRYDLVFFFPLESFYCHGDDPARMADLEYHRVYERVLSQLLSCRHVIHVGPTATRAAQIDEVVRGWSQGS